jgi:hypothetical protein
MKIDTNFGVLSIEKVDKNDYQIVNEKGLELARAHKERTLWEFRYLGGKLFSNTQKEGVQMLGEHYAKIKQIKVAADALGLVFWKACGWHLWAKDLFNKQGNSYKQNTTLSVWYKKGEAVYGVKQCEDGTFIGEYSLHENDYEPTKSEPMPTIKEALDFLKNYI